MSCYYFFMYEIIIRSIILPACSAFAEPVNRIQEIHPRNVVAPSPEDEVSRSKTDNNNYFIYTRYVPKSYCTYCNMSHLLIQVASSDTYTRGI